MKPQGGNEGCPKYDFLESDAAFSGSDRIGRFGEPTYDRNRPPKGIFLYAIVEGEKLQSA